MKKIHYLLIGHIIGAILSYIVIISMYYFTDIQWSLTLTEATAVHFFIVWLLLIVRVYSFAD